MATGPARCRHSASTSRARPHFFLGQKTYAAIAAPTPATERSQVLVPRLRLPVVEVDDSVCVLGAGRKPAPARLATFAREPVDTTESADATTAAMANDRLDSFIGIEVLGKGR